MLSPRRKCRLNGDGTRTISRKRSACSRPARAIASMTMSTVSGPRDENMVATTHGPSGAKRLTRIDTCRDEHGRLSGIGRAGSAGLRTTRLRRPRSPCNSLVRAGPLHHGRDVRRILCIPIDLTRFQQQPTTRTHRATWSAYASATCTARRRRRCCAGDRRCRNRGSQVSARFQSVAGEIFYSARPRK